ncbi:Scr1 family TA system antitoxin-like transcriptional regulator [Amycolatopsis sp. CA-230715]|uniref:Scr1 family TA system antitoxin-like transcriptional regulator n=1 Tax=Amycolatopsis sp. CA-230715 TaxID=2745196 RepID=UPI001C00A5B4|nr:Scr1 family TA system antitoxin-like transcriptional regulator [Amycolatopsis sp. CA-230715]
MGSTNASTPRARALADMLNAVLEKSRHSQRSIAKLMGYSHVTVGRWTRGEATPDDVTVATFLAHLGIVGEERDRILEVASAPDGGDWLTVGPGGIPSQLAGVMNLERNAVRLTNWSPLFVPGMLQTQAYARAIIERSPRITDSEIDHLVTVRLGRQHAISRDEAPLKITSFLGVPALRGGIGGTSVMCGQLRYLLKASRFENVDLRVVPVDGEWHNGIMGPFSLYDSSGGEPTVLHIEHHRTGAFISDPSDVHAYQEDLVKDLRRLAYGPDETRELIQEELKNREDA